MADVNYEEAKLANRPETDIWILQVSLTNTNRFYAVLSLQLQVGNKLISENCCNLQFLIKPVYCEINVVHLTPNWLQLIKLIY